MDVIYVFSVTIEPWGDGGGEDFTEGLHKTMSGALKDLRRFIDKHYPDNRYTMEVSKEGYRHGLDVTILDNDFKDYPLAYLTIIPLTLED